MILLSAIWGSAFFAIKISVSYFNPISVASYRLIIGAIALFIFFIYKKYSFRISFKNLFLIFIIGLTGNFLPFFLISWSEQYIQSNTAALLLSVAPILTLILSHFLTNDDKFTFLKFLSIFVGLIGVIFIFGLETIINIATGESKLLIPKLAIIVSALGYVLSSIIAYRLKNINTITLTTYVTISAAIISIPFLIYSEIIYPTDFNFKLFIPIIYLGLFPTALAFILRFYLISIAGPVFLSYVAYLIPVFAILWGYIFLRETVSINTILGIILILIGVFISQRQTLRFSMNKIAEKSINN